MPNQTRHLMDTALCPPISYTRAQFPTLLRSLPTAIDPEALHDFLVPIPRPDLMAGAAADVFEGES